MRRLTLAFSMLFTAVTSLACSDGSSDSGGGDSGGGTSTGGSSGAGTTGGSSTGGASGSNTGGASGSTTGGSSGTTGGSSGASTGGASGSGTGGGGFTKTGVCGQRSEATVTADTYTGYEEFYMVSQEVVDDGRLDEFNCLIRFDVARAGEAPAGCVDLDGVPCVWTNRVTFSNPTVITDIDGVCETNELMWNAAWRDGIDGTDASYGYIDMYQSHDSVVMKFSGAAGAEMWNVFGRASWDDMTNEFSFDNRIGACQY